MNQRSVFFEEWLRSLREQYKHVLRNEDKVTLPSLTAVMLDVGFGEDELAQLRVEATMHVDDVGPEHRADMNILQAGAFAQPHPAECRCARCLPIDESQFDAEGQPRQPDPEAAQHDAGHVFPLGPLESIEPADAAEPATFEDSIALSDNADDEAAGGGSLDDSDNGEGEDDPAAPQQISLF